MTILTTIFLAGVFVILAIILFSVGWLLTGKTKIQPGACGRDPQKKRDTSEGCGTSYHCSICDQEPPKKEEKNDVQ